MTERAAGEIKTGGGGDINKDKAQREVYEGECRGVLKKDKGGGGNQCGGGDGGNGGVCVKSPAAAAGPFKGDSIRSALPLLFLCLSPQPSLLVWDCAATVQFVWIPETFGCSGVRARVFDHRYVLRLSGT